MRSSTMIQDRNELISDKVPPGASGTTNEGKSPIFFFFYNYDDSVTITVINKYLLKRCAIILQASSIGFQTNTTAFPKYALETATPYVQEHSWFYTAVSLHKILIYGSEIISTAILPTGLMSEEVRESRNKDLKALQMKLHE